MSTARYYPQQQQQHQHVTSRPYYPPPPAPPPPPARSQTTIIGPKHVLFYSKYCEHCQEVMRTLVRKHARSLFTMVCVDQYRAQIPAFIQQVPTILTVDRQILCEEALFAYIASIEEPSADPVAAGMASKTGGVSDSTYSSFSFVNGPADIDQDCRFLSITPGQDEFPGIYCPPDDSLKANSSANSGPGAGPGSSGSTSRSGGVSLESIQTSRDQDLSVWRHSQAQAGGADPTYRGPGWPAS